MAISFIGSAVGVTTATLPAHQAGDLILVFAYNDAAATIPTIAAGYSTINAPTAGNSNGHRLAYKLATSSSESLGTWANATQLVAHVYRGAEPSQLPPAKHSLAGVLIGSAVWTTGLMDAAMMQRFRGRLVALLTTFGSA